MITIKSTNRFFDFYRQDKIDELYLNISKI